MKFKFLKIVLTGLIVLASASIKIVNADPILSTFEWEATCYNCKGEIGVDGGQHTTVNATLTLQNLDTLNGDWWEPSNFVSFAYTADSDHVYDFLLDSSSTQLDYAYGTAATADKFYIYIEWTDIANDVEKAGGHNATQEYKYIFDSSYDVSNDVSNDVDNWKIGRRGGSVAWDPGLDFGSTQTNTAAPTTNASAPPSLFIFALGLMALSFRRSKKQV
jgi:hypothetical protein